MRRYAPGDPGCIRRFRFDRLISCDLPQPRPSTIDGYAVENIRRRGIAMAMWGWFLDLCVIEKIVGLVLGVMRAVAR